MSKRILAITTCRVSSIEQLQSNSLNRQAQAVVGAAESLGATIPEDGQWSGSVSSKAGSNYSRKDLRAMIAYCKKNPDVKYVIVDEIDRFMRSIDEMFYFEVEFREKVGVKVWYAGDPALNSDDPLTKLRRAMEAFKAEGSNLERQIKSIKGQTAALQLGKFPFSPKPGYKRGYERGIQEVHEVRGPILKSTLLSIVNKLVTPTQGLIELNKSDFVIGHSQYKMDKFRKIVTDPFYAGIVEITKQVQVRNENGLHEPLITKDQHIELIRIMSDKKKTQSGPRKNGNPKYPLSNLVNCDNCTAQSNGRYVGFDHGNGKNPALVYEKYRCRACRKYLTRQDLHKQIEKRFNDSPLNQAGLNDFITALDIVWKQKEGETQQEANRITHKIRTLKESITNQVEAVTDPTNAYVKEDILRAIEKKKTEVTDLDNELSKLSKSAEDDKEKFLRFAFDYVENMGSNFFNISRENRLRCKQLVFPAGFYLDARNKVYTPEVSWLIRLTAKKKDTEVSMNSHLVRVTGL